MGQECPAFPFTGFVMNICVCTTGHRDVGDFKLCVVMPFGNWKGGELGMWEPRLVFEAGPGDLLSFPSSQITHFNLHMKGVRCSLVMQTDKDICRWTEGRNEWTNHMAI
jgi:uncharacterized protein (DUF2237 family)